ncbi:MAG: putative butyrate kinase [candidate division TA06 bacterium 32_111]|uniref:Probable butyrate kinase n=2 Tax=Bacteria candidate phyla TaxID=1783234 RepID=A0A117M6W9_UNCT6|nr:MAG: putative butyrate kinase [candidate division TA06 bacterium 32_111]KUK87684.1 MAG: putative butyrate kinase [candidate division TA06 bacterium 34_109]HAF07523.1 butyrate kinase [candidate division WOR-3 bacterium]HCP17592.1 butyrate kinase [candidate division WOR-3 bacterium]
MFKILAINPGATSTKIGYYEDDKEIFTESIRHHNEEIQKFKNTIDQLDMRVQTVKDFLKEKNIDLKDIDVFVARGGPFKPLKSGTYSINKKMIDDVLSGNVLADHVSNLACLIAEKLSVKADQKKFIVDPVSVDEFDDIARISGLEGIERKSLSHALNMKMIAKRWAKENKKDYFKSSLIVVHLGTGISVSAHKNGRMIDVNNANDEGPFSPQRTGTLPVTQLSKLITSKRMEYEEVKKMLTSRGGVYSYLNNDNITELVKLMEEGDEKVKLILSAMMYQVSKEIGAMATVLYGNVDCIIVTGGIAYNKCLTDIVVERTKFIAPVVIYPGEDEILALVLGALRVMKGEEKEMEY